MADKAYNHITTHTDFENHKSKKTDLLIIVIIINVIAIITTTMFVSQFGFIKIERQIISFSLSLILSYFLYQEKQWARLIFIILLSTAGYLSRNWFLELLKGPFTAINIFSIFMVWFYVSSAFYLAFIRKWPKRSFTHHLN